MKKLIDNLAKFAGRFRVPAKAFDDALAAAGIVLVTVGVSLVYVPAGLIAAGLLLFLLVAGGKS
jgi:hypothetical protein